MVGVTHSVLYLAVGVRLPTRAETLRHEISRERGVMVQLKLAIWYTLALRYHDVFDHQMSAYETDFMSKSGGEICIPVLF